MFSNAAGFAINGGTFSVNQASPTFRGIDILTEWIATGAFYDSEELYDTPKCHPRTRAVVLDDIMQWIANSESAREEFILWLFGPAGAGKSAIAKRIAQIAADKNLLIGTFFFSRASPTRNNKNRLITSLAYQLVQSIPDTRIHVEAAIQRDPVIFKKNIQTQIETLLIRPFRSVPTQVVPFPKLIIIDGLDECSDSKDQVSILDAISGSFTKHNLPIIFLVVSRPELDLVTSFNREPLKSIHRRIVLDDAYLPDDDIRLFFSEKFKLIRCTHPLRSVIPIPDSWPTPQSLQTLVEKSSGQFIYATTVVRFVESNHHQPTARLNIILGLSPPGTMKPFAELDALYNHVFSSVEDIQLTLRVLSLYVAAPSLASRITNHKDSISPDLFLSLEQGDVCRALINLSSIVSYDQSSGEVQLLHASLVDFLFDKQRSTTFYIDSASTCAEYVRRILQCIQGPDGIRAGDYHLFLGLLALDRWIIKGQLRSDILNFDLDAFITAVISHDRFFGSLKNTDCTTLIYRPWIKFLAIHLDDIDQKEAEAAFKPRLQNGVYQSDQQLTTDISLESSSTLESSHPQGLSEESQRLACSLSFTLATATAHGTDVYPHDDMRSSRPASPSNSMIMQDAQLPEFDDPMTNPVTPFTNEFSPALRSVFSALYHIPADWDLDDDYDFINQHSSGMPTIPAVYPSNLVPQELVNTSVKEYVHNVIEIQYPLGDSAILRSMIWEAVEVHQESREAVNLLSQVYSKRRHNPHRQILSDISFKTRVESLQATLTATGMLASADDAMAALHVVSLFLFDGGQGAWDVFLNVASTYVMTLLENPKYHRNYSTALQACGPKDEFIVKTTIWFDVLASITTQEQPRLLSAIRELFDPNRSYIGGSSVSYSMMSPMGCENIVVWALAEASSLSCWKRANKRRGILSRRKLIRKAEDIEIHLELSPIPLPQPSPETPEGWSRLLASQIFRSSTKLFLQSIVNGDHPRIPELREAVVETFKSIMNLPTSVSNNKPAIVRSTVFGIFLCGSLTDDQKERQSISLHLEQGSGADGVGNTSTVLRSLEHIWDTREKSPSSSVPWRELLKESQILLA